MTSAPANPFLTGGRAYVVGARGLRLHTGMPAMLTRLEPGTVLPADIPLAKIEFWLRAGLILVVEGAAS